MVTAQLYRYVYDSQQNLTGIYRNTDSYDSSQGNVYIHKNTQAFAKSYADPFITQYYNSYKAVYSPDKRLVSFEFASTSNDPDGMPIYNNVYKDTLFYQLCQSVLPVTLLSFTANKKDNNAVLQWKTANETNTASFAVQRSTDGIHFTTIGTLKAAGNSSGERTYTYTDYNISQLGVSKVYYRLTQQDINGTVHNSRTAQIDITGGRLSVTLSPNPVRSSINIYSPVTLQNAVITIADMSGKVVYTSRASLAAGTIFSIHAAAFARGIYFVTVQSASGTQVMKLVKE